MEASFKGRVKIQGKVEGLYHHVHVRAVITVGIRFLWIWQPTSVEEYSRSENALL